MHYALSTAPLQAAVQFIQDRCFWIRFSEPVRIGSQEAFPFATQLHPVGRTAAAPNDADAAAAASELGLVRLRQLDPEALRPPREQGGGKAKPPPIGSVPPAGFGLDVLPGAQCTECIDCAFQA